MLVHEIFHKSNKQVHEGQGEVGGEGVKWEGVRWEEVRWEELGGR